MAFTFLSGNGEYQFKDRPLKPGDIFSFLGTRKSNRMLVLTNPVFRASAKPALGGNLNIRYYDISVFSLLEQRRLSFQVTDRDCYRLIASLETL